MVLPEITIRQGQDKKKGIEQLETVAKHGHCLRPFAKVLLALTALREKNTRIARAQLTELVAEFPENSLFASEPNSRRSNFTL